ncbi:metallophosphoesterase family protein [Haloplasma contractile]|uniref:Phosphoesterase n=1 Tax=Haloplasma contractile SSD-17B TaxID=1033810 RepID=U2E9V8_9MOLU|nr:metallophosphoesterase family protein [Haloplasma contractile]ERJ11626.1 putative phosphoesterase ral function prediction only protein [Haloplasma contractile SSD-17B]
MKTLLIIADTHMPKRAKNIPSKLEKVLLEGVDLIIHAGDIQTKEMHNKFKQYAGVYAVYGNVDEEQLRQELPLRTIFEIEGVRIGLTHGHGKTKTTQKRALELFDVDQVDVIIYGHSHIPVVKKVDTIVMFNPGSATDKRRQEKFSFGKMTINEGTFELEHIFYSSKE